MQFDCISHEIPFTGVDNVGKIIRAFKLRVVIIGEYHILCPRVIAIISLTLHFILAIHFIFLTLRFSFVSKSHNLMLLPAESSVSPLGPSSMHLTPCLSAFHLLQKTKQKFINKSVINFRERGIITQALLFCRHKIRPCQLL